MPRASRCGSRQPGGNAPHRERVTETAGFYETVGFNDDTRKCLSVPAKHEAARRIARVFLAQVVAGRRLEEDEVAVDLAFRLAKPAHRL